MKTTPLILSIPTPCHESWDAMTPTDKGRFCQSCQKTVIDFSNMSDHEIISFINISKGNICGSFREGQLNRQLISSDNTRKRPFVSIAAMLTALSVSIPSVEANGKATQVQTMPEKSDVAVKPQQQPDTLPHITGIITDEAGDPIWYTSVRLDTTTIGTSTDTTGRFDLEIPSDYKEKTIMLVISYPGFYTQEVILPLAGIPNTSHEPMLCITMHPQYKGGIEFRRITLWERLRYKVRHLFH